MKEKKKGKQQDQWKLWREHLAWHACLCFLDADLEWGQSQYVELKPPTHYRLPVVTTSFYKHLKPKVVASSTIWLSPYAKLNNAGN